MSSVSITVWFSQLDCTSSNALSSPLQPVLTWISKIFRRAFFSLGDTELSCVAFFATKDWVSLTTIAIFSAYASYIATWGALYKSICIAELPYRNVLSRPVSLSGTCELDYANWPWLVCSCGNRRSQSKRWISLIDIWASMMRTESFSLETQASVSLNPWLDALKDRITYLSKKKPVWHCLACFSPDLVCANAYSFDLSRIS